MSRHSVLTSTIRPVAIDTRAQLMQAACSQAAAEAREWISSCRLDALAAGGTVAGSGLERATYRLGMVDASPMMTALVGTAAGGLLASSRKALADATAAAAAGDRPCAERLARQADRSLQRALRETAGRVRVDERHAVGGATLRALTSLGYRVEEATGARCLGITATRGHTLLVIRVQDGGALELDFGGCAERECEPAVSELLVGLAAEGIEAQQTTSTFHGDERGGQLLRSAASHAGTDGLAVGVVRAFETPSRAVGGSTRQAAGAAQRDRA